MTAPRRIYAGMETAHQSQGRWETMPFELPPDSPAYILEDPAALADSPEVQKLLAQAETHGVERAAQNIAAIERLAISASIASCTCLTKTPDINFHSADCRYVKLQYIIAQCEDFRDRAKTTTIKGEAT